MVRGPSGHFDTHTLENASLGEPTTPNTRLRSLVINGAKSDTKASSFFNVGVSGSWEPATIEQNAIVAATSQRNTLQNISRPAAGLSFRQFR